MRVSASKLRENIYQILDQVIATGEPVEIERKGKVLRISPEPKPGSKLSRLTKRPGLVHDIDSIAGMSWIDEWSEMKR